MWCNDREIYRHLLEKVETAMLYLTLESRNCKHWISTKGKSTLSKANINTNTLTTNSLTKTYYFYWPCKNDYTLKSRTELANFTNEAPDVSSAQIIYAHTLGAKCRD